MTVACLPAAHRMGCAAKGFSVWHCKPGQLICGACLVQVLQLVLDVQSRSGKLYKDWLK